LAGWVDTRAGFAVAGLAAGFAFAGLAAGFAVAGLAAGFVVAGLAAGFAVAGLAAGSLAPAGFAPRAFGAARARGAAGFAFDRRVIAIAPR
jgi:tetrahydromethanopterin S-methyltransferase subunit F